MSNEVWDERVEAIKKLIAQEQQAKHMSSLAAETPVSADPSIPHPEQSNAQAAAAHEQEIFTAERDQLAREYAHGYATVASMALAMTENGDMTQMIVSPYIYVRQAKENAFDNYINGTLGMQESSFIGHDRVTHEEVPPHMLQVHMKQEAGHVLVELKSHSGTGIVSLTGEGMASSAARGQVTDLDDVLEFGTILKRMFHGYDELPAEEKKQVDDVLAVVEEDRHQDTLLLRDLMKAR